MRPRFLVEPEAEAELHEAFAWYEGRVPGLGSEFMRAVRAAFSAIRRNPEQFPRVRNEIRRAACSTLSLRGLLRSGARTDSSHRGGPYPSASSPLAFASVRPNKRMQPAARQFKGNVGLCAR